MLGAAEEEMENRFDLRDARSTRSDVDWSIDNLVTGKNNARALLAQELGSSARIENLKIILAEFNPEGIVVLHYSNNERRLLNIPQRDDWWEAECPIATSIWKQLQGHMEAMKLERPYEFMNFIRLGEISFSALENKYKEVCVVLLKLLNDEEEHRVRIDNYEKRFEKEFNKMIKVHGEVANKIKTVNAAIVTRMETFEKRWTMPNDQQYDYMKLLNKALGFGEEAIESVEVLQRQFMVTLDRFVNSEDFYLVYYGKFHSFASVTIFERIRAFQCDLQGLKENIPDIVDSEKHLDGKLFVDGAKRYVAETNQVCTHIYNYAKILFDGIESLVARLNMAHDEVARLQKVMPLYEKDEINYQFAFLDNQENVGRLIRTHEILDKCLRLYSTLQKTPEELEESQKNTLI
uniref:DHC_N1 domain-containing protein n=1 Tax=Caenorhabditis tropicalis TaxID=1561998 RepID=A0A1I7UAJ3_9PELO